MRLPEPGTLFEGRYEIAEVLGQGGFARVYRARDRQTMRDVALKVISPHAGEYTDRTRQRFLREAQTIAQLQDPHTITLYAYGESGGGLLWMAMEYVRGRDLQTVIDGGPLPPAVVAHVLTQLLSSLREAHSRGVLHRDIKPANVLVHSWDGDDFAVKLLDFGIARPTDINVPSITKTGQIIGTPRYIAPEAVLGERGTTASDLYSLGLVAVEMLTARPAIEGDTIHELVRNQVAGPRITISELLAPPALGRIVERLCARPPDERFQTADEVLAALSAVRNEIRAWRPAPNHRPLLEPPPRPEPAPTIARSKRSTRMLVGAIGAAGAAVGIVLAAVTLLSRQGGAPERSEAAVGPPELRRVVHRAAEVSPPEPGAADAGDDAASDGGAGRCAEPPFRGFGTIERMDGLDPVVYHLYIPRTYRTDRPNPLIVVFRDSLVTEREAAERAQMDRLAEEMGAVVWMPVDSDRGPWWEVEDALRVRDGLEEVSQQLCIDPQRLFGYGHGAGGRLAERAHCILPGVFKATATTAFRPGESEEACRPTMPAPHLHTAALENRYNMPGHARECGLEMANTLEEQDARWREASGCEGRKREWYRDEHGECWTWDCEKTYVTCRIRGGREWHGTTPRSIDLPGCDGPPVPFGYRTVLRRFFDEATSNPK